MKTSRFTEEQFIKALREQESRQKTVAQVCKEMGVSQGTFFKWKQKYGKSCRIGGFYGADPKGILTKASVLAR